MSAAPRWILAFLLFVPSALPATDLKQQTVDAWNEYIHGVNAGMVQRLENASKFLWIDEAPERRERLRRGEVLVEAAGKDMPVKVPLGLIHDWIGAVFIPNTTVESVFGMLNDYGKYDRYYNPAVVSAKLVKDAGTTRDFSLVLAEKAPFVSTAINSDYTSQTNQVDKQRWYTISYSTRIQQIDDYGKAEQHVLPPDQGDGYIWRLYSIQRFEEKDGGVYVEMEAIALSRNVPFELQWLVKPILQRLPRNSMTATLEKTRDAVSTAGDLKKTEMAKLGTPNGTAPSNAEGTHSASAKTYSLFRPKRLPTAPTLAIRAPN